MTALRTLPPAPLPSPAPRRRPGGPASRDRVTIPRLVLRYTVTGLVVLVVVAVITVFASRLIGTQEATGDAVRATTLVAEVAVQPVLTDALLAGDPAALAAFDRSIRTHVVRGSLVRVKLWDETGRIVYSDEPRLVGDRFELSDEARSALSTGAPLADISDLSEPENRFEERAVELLEVYERVQTPSGRPVLFEAYFSYAGVTAAGRGVWLRFAPFMLGALALLALLQIPIAVSLARRLRRTQLQREHLLTRAIEATDAERRRIAGDLHDGVVQDLAGVAFSLSAVTRRGQGEQTMVEVEDAAACVRHAVRGLRSLLVEIYPPNLYEEGLEAALSDLLARLAVRDMQTSLEVSVPVAELDLDEIELLYRVAQEGLRNVAEHADARSVAITVEQVAATVVLRVVDDGRGLGPGPLPERPGHFGLRALADLADRLGATLELESGPGGGTVLQLTVPHR
jgi:two-component system, NarL family, sensor kinase